MPITNNRKLVPLSTLEHEMLIAGIVWVMLGALCVLAANAWAQGTLSVGFS